jgi:hypothetical protein
MKSWVLDDSIRDDPSLATTIEQSKGLLEDIVGLRSAPLVDARWSAMADRGKKIVTLTLSDWTWPTGVQAQFEPNDLASPSQMRTKISWLWGDLLQERNHQQVRELLQEGV